MKEQFFSIVIFPFYAVGWVAGLLARWIVIAWHAVKLGYLEAKGGDLG